MTQLQGNCIEFFSKPRKENRRKSFWVEIKTALTQTDVQRSKHCAVFSNCHRCTLPWSLHTVYFVNNENQMNVSYTVLTDFRNYESEIMGWLKETAHYCVQSSIFLTSSGNSQKHSTAK